MPGNLSTRDIAGNKIRAGDESFSWDNVPGYISSGAKTITNQFGGVLNDLTGKTQAQEFEAEQAKIANEASAHQAQIQREHELYMSNTAYQRAVADMKAAGLNPALLSGMDVGTAASTSSSAAASQQKANDGSGNQVLSALIGLIGLIAGTALRGSALNSVAGVRAASAKEVALLNGSSRVSAAGVVRKVRHGKLY